MELVELVRGAQNAMELGDYRLATMASLHGLAVYPSCLAAHRILGEAHLELGEAGAAIEHFERTLAVDPLNVVARLGLGVSAEEQKDYGSAYTHYLHAWESNPALDQVRDELVRLRGLLGVEDRLHPSRAGLAGIHTRGGQLHRAANEWRAVLVAEPDSQRARTSFAELLWRQGEDGLAAVACRDALRGSPENARALAILADIERRRQGSDASELAQRYRAVDPTGDVVALLREWRADVDLGFLATESATVDDFDFTALAVPADQLGAPPKIATNALAGNQIAAPDLWDTLVKDLSSDLPSTGIAPTLASGVEPFAWDAAGSDQAGDDAFANLGIQPFSMVDLDAGSTDDPTPFSFADSPAGSAQISTADIYTAALGIEPTVTSSSLPSHALVESGAADDGLAAMFSPATDREIADATPPPSDGGSSVEAFWEDASHTSSPNGASNGSLGLDDLAGLGIEPFSFEGMAETSLDALPVAESPPRARPADETPSPPMHDVPTLAGAASAPTAAPPPFVDPFVTADGTIDLTVGWDSLDSQLAAATPSIDVASQYDDLAAALGIDGIVPFDADLPGEDDDAWAPLTDDDLGVINAVAPPADRADAPSPEVTDVDWSVPVADWATEVASNADLEPTSLEALMTIPLIEASTFPDGFDDEVIFGIPSQQASGYTELLRHVDTEELHDPTDVDTVIDPFASPDASGNPLAFEDLLAVTSRDGTAPLVGHGMAAFDELHSPFDFLGTDPSQAKPRDGDGFSVVDLRDLDLDDFDPFNVEELEVSDAVVDGGPDGIGAHGIVEPGDLLTDVSWLSAGEVDDSVEPVALGVMSKAGVDPAAVEPVTDDSLVSEPQDIAWATVTPFDVEATLENADVPATVAASAGLSPAVGSPVTGTAPDLSDAGGVELNPGLASWPAFLNQTSNLVDRDLGDGSVFDRLRSTKAALVVAGGLVIDRRIVPATSTAAIAEHPVQVAPIADAQLEHGRDSPPDSSGPGEQTRLDLKAIRGRLIEDASAAEEIAGTLEKAVGDGLSDPFALRILGEAYLKLGRMDQAAAQFRQAMLARQRTR